MLPIQSPLHAVCILYLLVDGEGYPPIRGCLFKMICQGVLPRIPKPLALALATARTEKVDGLERPTSKRYEAQTFLLEADVSRGAIGARSAWISTVSCSSTQSSGAAAACSAIGVVLKIGGRFDGSDA